jgi:hypothetical protein
LRPVVRDRANIPAVKYPTIGVNIQCFSQPAIYFYNPPGARTAINEPKILCDFDALEQSGGTRDRF